MPEVEFVGVPEISNILPTIDALIPSGSPELFTRWITRVQSVSISYVMSSIGVPI